MYVLYVYIYVCIGPWNWSLLLYIIYIYSATIHNIQLYIQFQSWDVLLANYLLTVSYFGSVLDITYMFLLCYYLISL